MKRALLLAFVTWPSACAIGGGAGVAEDPIQAEGGAATVAVTSIGSQTASATTTGTGGAGGGAELDCALGEKRCGGICIDVTADPLNCGDCQLACDSAETCVDGQCIVPSTSATSSVTTATTATTTGGGGGSCNPLSPATVCGGGQRCMPQTAGPPTCVPTNGNGNNYDWCDYDSECDAINLCVYPGPFGYCMQWCQSTDQCPGFFDQCTSLSPAVFVDGQEWGVCWDGIG